MLIACDIGGTKFRVAKSKDGINFDEPIIKETPKDPNEGLKMIAETIYDLVVKRDLQTGKILKSEKIDSAVFGIAGVLDETHNFLIKAPHLTAWEKIPIREFFEKELSKISEKKGLFDLILGRSNPPKIFVENDTSIVGLGEAVAGAGKSFEKVVYITVSTGIGGVKIVRGKFEENNFGFEPGFQILNNQTGENWEDLCSGTEVAKKSGMEPKDFAKTGGWAEVEKNVAIGIHNCILHWSPDVVVVGGSMARDFNFENLKNQITKMMKIHPTIPEIKMAELGSIGGIYGGFAYFRDKNI